MAHVIAVAGKGGVGKTTLTGLIIQYLGEKGKGPILAVDADANSNLNEVLGVEVEATLGEVREEVSLMTRWLRTMISTFWLWDVHRGKAATAL